MEVPDPTTVEGALAVALMSLMELWAVVGRFPAYEDPYHVQRVALRTLASEVERWRVSVNEKPGR